MGYLFAGTTITVTANNPTQHLYCNSTERKRKQPNERPQGRPSMLLPAALLD
ncbi:hypothetical protein ZHAS_00021725 [Anopheles sinensis]|uniref:Uncharacterized protein n=1 Tax=Anopheles sinensis TaxID=74873 RepID=A0A084WTF5_ANOSI|nr:hypothetical protein ZHAS_00021725 [Anopheles sinensis]